MKILLLQLKRIGDLILTTPAINAVREKFPEAHLWLVVSPAVSELLPAIGGIDKVLIVSGEPGDALDWLSLFVSRFDYCLDFTRNDRSSFLTFLSHARKRITSDHPNLRTKFRARSYNELVGIAREFASYRGLPSGTPATARDPRRFPRHSTRSAGIENRKGSSTADGGARGR